MFQHLQFVLFLSRRASLCSLSVVWKCVADWRDVDLMRDIEAATGEDLGSSRVGGKKQKGKKKKYPNLSDLKQSSNTSRSRLERKVFNKYDSSALAKPSLS